MNNNKDMNNNNHTKCKCLSSAGCVIVRSLKCFSLNTHSPTLRCTAHTSLCLCHSKFCGDLIPSPQHWSGNELICMEFVSCVYSINYCKFKSIFCSTDLCQLKQCTQLTKLLMCRYLPYRITWITSLLALSLPAYGITSLLAVWHYIISCSVGCSQCGIIRWYFFNCL